MRDVYAHRYISMNIARTPFCQEAATGGAIRGAPKQEAFADQLGVIVIIVVTIWSGASYGHWEVSDRNPSIDEDETC
jgi:hypothetical protein